MMKLIQSPKGEYELLDNIIVSRYAQEVHVGMEDGEEIVSLLHQHFSGDFGWISDRVNSYSFDTMLIMDVANQFKNLVCVASVVHGAEVKKTPFLKEIFPPGFPAKEFNSLFEATQWMKSILDKSNNTF